MVGVVAVGWLVLISGCGFENPLARRPSKDINTWLLGVWVMKDGRDKMIRAMVTPRSSDRYLIVVEEEGVAARRGKRLARFEGYIVRVGRMNFLNLRCLEGSGMVGEGRHFFAQYQVLEQNSVRVREPVLTAGQGASSYRLRQEVRARLKEGTLFVGPGSDWRRVSEVYWGDANGIQPQQPLRFPELAEEVSRQRR